MSRVELDSKDFTSVLNPCRNRYIPMEVWERIELPIYSLQVSCLTIRLSKHMTWVPVTPRDVWTHAHVHAAVFPTAVRGLLFFYVFYKEVTYPLAEAEGFEPSNWGIKTLCVTASLYPIIYETFTHIAVRLTTLVLPTAMYSVYLLPPHLYTAKLDFGLRW